MILLQILQDFPEELRGDVSLHLHNEILELPLFETATAGCRKLLSLKVSLITNLIICHKIFKMT